MPTPTHAAPDRSAVWAAMLVLYVVWGSTYLGIAIAVDSIPPFMMAAVRFWTAGLILLGWSIATERRSFVFPTRREWRDSAVVGALLLGGGMGMVAFGEQSVPSGVAALLVSMMPIWVALLGGVFLGQRLPRLAVLGIVIGFGGIAILVGPSAFGGAGALDPVALAALLISPLAWSIGSLFASHRATLPRRPLVATGAQMLLGGTVLAGMAIVAGEPARFDPAAVTSASIAALLYLTVIGSLLAFTTFGWLLRVAPLPLVTTYAYVNPVVAVILGWLILGEPIDARTVLAGVVIVSAVALIITSRGPMRAPHPDLPDLAPSIEAEPSLSPAFGSSLVPATADSAAAGPLDSPVRNPPG